MSKTGKGRVARSRVGGIGMLLCLLSLTILGGMVVHASPGEHQTTVAVNIAESISVVAWPGEYLMLASGAMPGEVIVSPEQRFTVKANSTWGIEISCDVEQGRLREYDPGTNQYVMEGHVLENPLEWALSPGGPWQALSTAPQPLIATAGATGAEGQDVGFFLRFTSSYGDHPLGGGRDYRITLQYTAGLHY